MNWHNFQLLPLPRDRDRGDEIFLSASACLSWFFVEIPDPEFFVHGLSMVREHIFGYISIFYIKVLFSVDHPSCASSTFVDEPMCGPWMLVFILLFVKKEVPLTKTK